MFAASLKEFWIGTRYTHINKPCKDIVQRLEMGSGYERVFWNHGGIPAIELRLLRQLEPQPRWEQQRLGLIASRRNPAERSRCHQLPGAYPARRRSTIGEAWPGLTQSFWDARSKKGKNDRKLRIWNFEPCLVLEHVGICWIQMFGKVCWCLVKFVGGDTMMLIFFFKRRNSKPSPPADYIELKSTEMAHIHQLHQLCTTFACNAAASSLPILERFRWYGEWLGCGWVQCTRCLKSSQIGQTDSRFGVASDGPRNNQEDDKEIYIERKIHHEGWGGAKSAKERRLIWSLHKFAMETYLQHPDLK